MAYSYTKGRPPPSDVTGGELEFSESERVYGRGPYGRPGHSRTLERTLDSDRRYPVAHGGNVVSAGTVNIDRLKSNGHKDRYTGYQGKMGYGDYRGGTVITERARVPERRIVEHTSERRIADQNLDRRLVEHRSVSRSPDRRRTEPSPERYYVREVIEEKPKETADKEVETCCCGCVQIVDSEYCCKGMKVFRCTCFDSGDEEEEEKEKEEKIEKRYLFYRTHDRVSEEEDSFTDETDELDHTYAEIDNKKLISNRPRSATYEKRIVHARDYGQSTHAYADVTRSARLMSRPRSAENERYVRKVQPVQIQNHYDRTVPPVQHRPPVYENVTHVSRKPPMPPTQKPAQRHVGVQMTTKYMVEPPKKKLVRNIGCQTMNIPSPASTPPTSSSSSPSITPVQSPRGVVSSPPPSPSPSPSFREETPTPEVVPTLKSYDPMPVKEYKTAVINIHEPDQEPQEQVIVIAKPPPRPPSPPPSPPPVVYYSSNPEPKKEPEVNKLTEHFHYPLVDKSLPVNGKVRQTPPPVIYRIIKPEYQPEVEPEPNTVVEPFHDSIPVKSLPVKRSSNKKKEEPLLRVFTKSATALFKVNQVPRGKSMMVRVGGGWMKVEHHRNHHIPLKVFEHNRDANRDKFLFIKSRFARKPKYVPIAYKKYREEIVRPPWNSDTK